MKHFTYHQLEFYNGSYFIPTTEKNLFSNIYNNIKYVLLNNYVQIVNSVYWNMNVEVLDTYFTESFMKQFFSVWRHLYCCVG